MTHPNAAAALAVQNDDLNQRRWKGFEDQFGSDLRPVGPEACARRACQGCCYCSGQRPQIRLELREFTFDWPSFPEKDYHGPEIRMVPKWLTVPQLNDWMHDKMKAALSELGRLENSLVKPVPVYLLGRASPWDVDEAGRATVIAALI